MRNTILFYCLIITVLNSCKNDKQATQSESNYCAKKANDLNYIHFKSESNFSSAYLEFSDDVRKFTLVVSNKDSNFVKKILFDENFDVYEIKSYKLDSNKSLQLNYFIETNGYDSLSGFYITCGHVFDTIKQSDISKYYFPLNIYGQFDSMRVQLSYDKSFENINIDSREAKVKLKVLRIGLNKIKGKVTGIKIFPNGTKKEMDFLFEKYIVVR